MVGRLRPVHFLLKTHISIAMPRLCILMAASAQDLSSWRLLPRTAMSIPPHLRPASSLYMHIYIYGGLSPSLYLSVFAMHKSPL
jgi:hypothetical protein